MTSTIQGLVQPTSKFALYEGQTKFDIIYGQVDQQGSSATVGVQTVERTGAYFTQ